MSILRRTIHPVVRVLDEAKGIVEYVASDESLDSYNEIVRASGAQFNRFAKNAPFVDSHDYSTIGRLLGKVIDFRVRGAQVIETVQWAINMGPEKTLADWGFQMTTGGFLKAVSIGFQPVSVARPGDEEFQAAMEDMEVPTGTDVRAIYLAWEQMELSACVIGANPNAVAQIEKAWKAGVVTDSAINQFSRLDKNFARAFERRSHTPSTITLGGGNASAVDDMLVALGGKKSTTQTPNNTPMKKTSFLDNYDNLANQTKAAFGEIEFARREGNGAEIQRALQRACNAMAGERRMAGDPVARFLEANPEQRYLWNGLCRRLFGIRIEDNPIENEVMRTISPGIAPNDPLGSGLFNVVVSPDLFDNIYTYGAFRDLGVNVMPSQYTSFLNVTALPTILIFPSDKQGYSTLPVDTTTAGLQLPGPGAAYVCNSMVGLIQASREVIADNRVDLSTLIIRLFFQAIAAAFDYCAFSGTGAHDVVNADQTGIFLDPNIKTNQIGEGTAIANLGRNDFINTIGLINPAALQRPCRWYISPKFLTELLKLRDGSGINYLLKTPADTGGEWNLVGFPVTWAAAAPGQAVGGAKVAAFGQPEGYTVGIRNLFELMESDGANFAINNRQIRAIARGKCFTRDATFFGTLQLANK